MNIEATMSDWVVPCGDNWSELFQNTFPRYCYAGIDVAPKWMPEEKISGIARRPHVLIEEECAKPVEEDAEKFVWLVYDKQSARTHQVVEAKDVDKKASVAERFATLSQRWKDEAGAESSLSRITGNINYLSIIGLGMDAVPIILFDLQKTGAPWFVALEAITGRTGMGSEYPGNFRKKKELWLQWGREQGYT